MINKNSFLTSFFILIAFGLNAQTTQDEYLFASGGFLKVRSLSDLPSGYFIDEFTDIVDSEFAKYWNEDYDLLVLKKIKSNDTLVVAAILVSGYGQIAYCIPHPSSSNDILNQSLNDFNEFWKTRNKAIMFHFIQSVVWGDWMKKEFQGKTLLQADYDIANNWEHEPADDKKHWGEFLFKISGREPTYNAFASFPEYNCEKGGKVLLQFTISESGIVTTSKILNDTYFKGYNGTLYGTNTTSDCLIDYSQDLIKQFTFLPSASQTEGYVLFNFHESRN